MGKLTISMAIFNSKLLVYQRVFLLSKVNKRSAKYVQNRDGKASVFKRRCAVVLGVAWRLVG